MPNKKLKEAAFIFLVLGIWTAVMWVVSSPTGPERQMPLVESASAETDNVPLEDGKGATSPILTPGKVSSKLIKTTCYTGVECRGAIKQNIKVGEVATNLAPQGSVVLIGGVRHTVHSYPDSKTQADIFFGYDQEAYKDCLARGVKYLSFEIIP